MTNRNRFFANGMLLTAVGITIRTVSLFFNAFITRIIGAEGLGLYTVVMTIYAFAVTFATSGISLTVTRLVAAAIGEKRERDVSKILTGSIIYALIFSIAATAVLFFGAEFFGIVVLGDERGAVLLKILAPSLIPLALVSVFSGYFVGIRRVACNAFTQIFGQIFKIFLTVFLVLKLSGLGVEYSAIALSLGVTLTEIMSFFVIFLQFLWDRRKKTGNHGAELSSVSKTALPLAFSAYIRQALLTLEHILIPKRLKAGGADATEALASYGVLHGMALPLILYPMATLSSFSGLLVPEFAERSAAGHKESLKRLASEAFSKTLVYAVATCIFLFLFSEELGYVIYDSYSAGVYIAILASVVPIMYLDHVTDSVLKGIGEQVYSMWVNITDSFLSIILVWILIPEMGILGYALCIIIMEGYNFILSLIRLFSKIKFRISLVRSLVLPACSAIVAAILSKKAFLVGGALITPYWLVIKIVFFVCAFILIYRLSSILYSRIYTLVKKKKEERCPFYRT